MSTLHSEEYGLLAPPRYLEMADPSSALDHSQKFFIDEHLGDAVFASVSWFLPSPTVWNATTQRAIIARMCTGLEKYALLSIDLERSERLVCHDRGALLSLLLFHPADSTAKAEFAKECLVGHFNHRTSFVFECGVQHAGKCEKPFSSFLNGN